MELAGVLSSVFTAAKVDCRVVAVGDSLVSLTTTDPRGEALVAACLAWDVYCRTGAIPRVRPLRRPPPWLSAVVADLGPLSPADVWAAVLIFSGDYGNAL